MCLKTRKHERKGWLKDILLQEGEITGEKNSLWRRVLSDYKCQLSGIEGIKSVMGDAFVDPRKHIGTPGVASDFVSKKRPSQIGVPKTFGPSPTYCTPMTCLERRSSAT